jgi:hypothetical protein
VFLLWQPAFADEGEQQAFYSHARSWEASSRTSRRAGTGSGGSMRRSTPAAGDPAVPAADLPRKSWLASISSRCPRTWRLHIAGNMLFLWVLATTWGLSRPVGFVLFYARWAGRHAASPRSAVLDRPSVGPPARSPRCWRAVPCLPAHITTLVFFFITWIELRRRGAGRLVRLPGPRRRRECWPLTERCCVPRTGGFAFMRQPRGSLGRRPPRRSSCLTKQQSPDARPGERRRPG